MSNKVDSVTQLSLPLEVKYAKFSLCVFVLTAKNTRIRYC